MQPKSASFNLKSHEKMSFYAEKYFDSDPFFFIEKKES
ncbi:hypothetical protein BSM4216_0688 [Bacillus smithii]|nr:hypothetical protein BSM4216_0688 [Bacillus smithii]